MLPSVTIAISYGWLFLCMTTINVSAFKKDIPAKPLENSLRIYYSATMKELSLVTPHLLSSIDQQH
jgi:hypothetical protein